MSLLFAAFALCRAVSVAAVALLFGAAAMLALGGAPRLGRDAEVALRRTLRAAAAIGLLAALCLLPLQAASIAGDWGALRDPDMLATVALQTRYGQAWMPRVFGAVLALAVVLWVRPGRPWVLAWVAALGLGPLSLSGHAAMHEGWLGAAHAVNDALHGLSAAFWLGSLPVFLSWLAAWQRPGHRAEATRALLRFSTCGHVAVAVLLLSGIGNAVLILGAGGVDPASDYQRLLWVKIVLALVMTGLALVNRYRWIARIRTHRAMALHAIRRNTIVELALGAVVLVAVGILGLMSPL
jgi:putative copper resistance protein D